MNLMHSDIAPESREIYGITGARGAGKDTFARLVNLEASPPFKLFWFAGPLKQAAMDIFGVSEAMVNDPAQKEQPFVIPMPMDEYLDAMRRWTGLPIQPRGLVAVSPRRLLQYLGTDYVRSIQDDYWIRKLEDAMRGERRVLIPDTRFPNEAAFLQRIQAKIVRVQRDDGSVNDDASTHASELHWKTIPADLIVINHTGCLNNITECARLVGQGRFLDAVRTSCSNWQAVA